MSTLRQITLGSEGIKYMEEVLADGKTLARCLRERPDLRTGKIVTHLPASVSGDAARQFATGGKLPEPRPETHLHKTAPDGTRWTAVPIPNMKSQVVTMVRTFLERHTDGVCIFEEALASPNDPCVSSWDTPFLLFNDEIYHILTPSLGDRHAERVVTRAWGIYPPLIGAMTCVTEDFNARLETGQIDSDSLRLLAQRAETVLIGAYDGEGYLVWSKP